MLSSILKRLSRRNTQADESEEVEEEASPPAYFSTHRTVARKYGLAQYIQDFGIPVKQDCFSLVEGEAMDFDSIKGAYSLGSQRLDQDLFAWYVGHSFIGYQACAIIAQHWLVNKACSIKGKDAVRNGYKVSINDGSEDVDPKIIAAITKADKKFKVKKNLQEASKFNEVFGIRHLLFVVESSDEDYYSKPFNLDGIKPGAYRGISQVDPYWITPWLNGDATAQPASQDFYEPTYWVISGKKYHKSHFVILRGPEVSDILKPSYLYGGLPLTQRIMERVYAAERTANEAPMLAMTKRLNVRKMDLDKAVANQDAFEEALAVQQEYRDNYGILAMGLGEDAIQLDTSLADLDATIMTQYQLVAAEANVPATKLLGTSPKGFQSTGEHEISTYHEELETMQEHDFSPIVERHHLCLLQSEIKPKFGKKKFEIDVSWNPVNVPTNKEIAEVNESKARTDVILMDAGAIDQYDVRDRIISDEDSGYNGLESVQRPEQKEDLEPEESTTEPDAADTDEEA